MCCSRRPIEYGCERRGRREGGNPPEPPQQAVKYTYSPFPWRLTDVWEKPGGHTKLFHSSSIVLLLFLFHIFLNQSTLRAVRSPTVPTVNKTHFNVNSLCKTVSFTGCFLLFLHEFILYWIQMCEGFFFNKLSIVTQSLISIIINASLKQHHETLTVTCSFEKWN